MVSSRVAPFPRADVDTDQIIPARFLRSVNRTGYGPYLFHGLRFTAAGEPDPGFEPNEPRYTGAEILAAGANFGCGSSREHAAWALLDHGFRAIIAPGFADIFRANCHQNGLLPVVLDERTVDTIVQQTRTSDDYAVTIDLESTRVTDSAGLDVAFDIDPFRRDCLLNGWDDIDLTLQHEAAIRAYEQSRGLVPYMERAGSDAERRQRADARGEPHSDVGRGVWEG
jgi:3-isopropylmalate/(R)-2-methylmalate dehydratase small subunit